MNDIDPRIQVNSVVQLSPETKNRAFAACMLVVTEVKPWGVQGYVQALGEAIDQQGGAAYYRAPYAEIEYVGEAAWIVAEQ